MTVIRAVKTVKNGQVLLNLPAEFSGQQVEIIVSTKEYYQVKKKSLKGVLENYANPELIALESTVWEKVAEKKYDNSRC